MSNCLNQTEKKLGFGFMRLPMLENGEVDVSQCKDMVDLFLQAGFRYFDTAHGYLDGKSELAVKECLTCRYPRESYFLADKLSQGFFQKEEDIRPFFESQLEACGVDYFDVYLMHAITEKSYSHYVSCHAFEVVQELKKEGKIRHIGMSFHDKAEVLETILKEHPEIEVVQLQFNYVDFDDPVIQSEACYRVCERYQKPVIVMEPVKGGALVHVPQEGEKLLKELGEGSQASYAIRFCASFPQVVMVLSGMSDLAQLKDNIGFMKEFIPFSEKEFQAVEQVRKIIQGQDTIACTKCRYCTDGCPQKIGIPDLFSCYNSKKQYQNWNSDFYYGVYTAHGGKASDCIACGKCEYVCPQHLPIRELLKETAAMFEKQEETE